MIDDKEKNEKEVGSLEEKKEGGYLLFLVRIKDPQILERIISLQNQLRQLFSLEVILPEELHISIKDGGYLTSEVRGPEEISQTTLPQVIAQAREILEKTDPFKVRLGRLGVFPEVVFIEIEDNGAIRQIQNQLTRRISALPFSSREKGRFLPHISIARLRTHQTSEMVKQMLEDLRERTQPGGEFEIDSIEIVKIDERKKPTFEALERFSLADMI